MDEYFNDEIIMYCEKEEYYAILKFANMLASKDFIVRIDEDETTRMIKVQLNSKMYYHKKY